MLTYRDILRAVPFAMIACAIGGTGAVHAYMTAPSAVGAVPESWPDGAGIMRDDRGWTLVVAVHPKCPCTEASVAELERVLSDAEPRPDVIAVVRVPREEAVREEWTDTGLIRVLRRATEGRLRVIRDESGDIAGLFGALTSGHAILFDPDGVRRFEGGVTRSRGMRGPSTGTASIAALLAGRAAPAETAAVYGCPLCDGPGVENQDTPVSVELPVTLHTERVQK